MPKDEFDKFLDVYTKRVYEFVNRPDIYAEYQKLNEKESISMVQFVLDHKREEFRQHLLRREILGVDDDWFGWF